MKLNTEAAFEDLTALREKIGARLVGWEPKPPISAEIEIEDVILGPSGTGIVDIIGPQGLIGVYGRQCLIYIPHIKSWRGSHSFPKFHFMECSTIKQMRGGGRFERYTVTNKTSGYFSVYIDEVKQEVRLDVCKNCLSEYKPRRYDFHNFNIEAFFKDCHYIFEALPSTYDGNIPEDIYLSNWPAISYAYRANAGWCCEQCGVNLSGHTKLLDTHHRDGVKTNTDTRNLIALCKLCHAEQFQHDHMEVAEEDKAVIIEIRRCNSDNARKFRDMCAESRISLL